MITIEEIDNNLLYSPAAYNEDTRPAEIYSFFPYEYPERTQELNRYVKTLNDDHRLVHNYKNLNFFEHEFISVWKRHGNIVGFASGASRENYPINSIRILNRFYHDKQDSRVGFTREVLRPATFNCLQHQLILSDRLFYDCAFISREPRTNKFLKMFAEALNNKSTHKWEFKEGPFLVTPNQDNPKAWQSVIVTYLNGSDFRGSWE